MSEYRRSNIAGGTYFFTVVTAKRNPVLTEANVRYALRVAINQVREYQPFKIDAWVLLPDHMHCIWTLPDDDNDYSSRWGKIKRSVSKALSYSGNRDSGLWQRRFWEHQIRDDLDLIHHTEYIFINPVKHGLCNRVIDWPYSSFHRFVRQGLYPQEWAGDFIETGNYGE